MSAARLLLVDGLNVAYRAFYAIPDLATHTGQPTNAVFGFIRMLHQLQQQWQPTHWAVIFDGGLPAHRLQALPEYKAQRPPMPAALRSQLETINEYLERAEVCAVRIEAQEADDVIASLATQGASAAADIFVATSDKDALQLVDDRITVVSPVRTGERSGPAEVRAKCGVAPEQIAEWLALTGDAVDNIPGVPGVGPKTAAKLLNAFHSLAALWERIGEVEPERIRQALLTQRDVVERNLAMIRLWRDVDCALDWPRCAVRPEQPERLLPFYDAMEFSSLAGEMREGRLF